MDVLVLSARIALAAVFGVAAIAKLRGQAEFREAVRVFGIPAPLVGVTGGALPVAEAGVAAALLSAWAWPAAIAAAALLAVFTIGIGVNLLRGRTPNCRCFGQLQAKPIGADTLVRNTVLLAAGVAIVGAGPASSAQGALDTIAGMSGMRPGVVALILAVVAIVAGQGLLQWNLMLQNGRLLHRIDHLERHTGALAPIHPHPTPRQLPAGAIAPAFELAGSTGVVLSLSELRAAGKPVMLVFTEPGCPACKAFMPTVREWQDQYASRVRIAVITTPSPDTAHVSGVRTALVQRDREVSDLYGISAIPAALIVRADGTIGSTVMLGGDAIATLLPPVSERDDAPALSIREALA